MKWSRLSFTLTYSPFHNGANVHRLRRSNLTHFYHLRWSFGFDKVCRVILKQQSTNVKFWRREGQIVKIWRRTGRRVFSSLQIFTNWTYFWIGMLLVTKTPSNFHNVTGTKIGARVTEGCASQGIGGVARAVGHLREWPVTRPIGWAI